MQQDQDTELFEKLFSDASFYGRTSLSRVTRQDVIDKLDELIEESAA